MKKRKKEKEETQAVIQIIEKLRWGPFGDSILFLFFVTKKKQPSL